MHRSTALLILVILSCLLPIQSWSANAYISRETEVTSATLPVEVIDHVQASTLDVYWTYKSKGYKMKFAGTEVPTFVFGPTNWSATITGTFDDASQGRVKFAFTPVNSNTNGHYPFNIYVTSGTSILARTTGFINLKSRAGGTSPMPTNTLVDLSGMVFVGAPWGDGAGAAWDGTNWSNIVVGSGYWASNTVAEIRAHLSSRTNYWDLADTNAAFAVNWINAFSAGGNWAAGAGLTNIGTATYPTGALSAATLASLALADLASTNGHTHAVSSITNAGTMISESTASFSRVGHSQWSAGTYMTNVGTAANPTGSLNTAAQVVIAMGTNFFAPTNAWNTTNRFYGSDDGIHYGWRVGGAGGGGTISNMMTNAVIWTGLGGDGLSGNVNNASNWFPRPPQAGDTVYLPWINSLLNLSFPNVGTMTGLVFYSDTTLGDSGALSIYGDVVQRGVSVRAKVWGNVMAYNCEVGGQIRGTLWGQGVTLYSYILGGSSVIGDCYLFDSGSQVPMIEGDVYAYNTVLAGYDSGEYIRGNVELYGLSTLDFGMDVFGDVKMYGGSSNLQASIISGTCEFYDQSGDDGSCTYGNFKRVGPAWSGTNGLPFLNVADRSVEGTSGNFSNLYVNGVAVTNGVPADTNYFRNYNNLTNTPTLATNWIATTGSVFAASQSASSSRWDLAYLSAGTGAVFDASQSASSGRWDLAYLSAGTGAVFDASQASSSNRWDQWSVSSNAYVPTNSLAGPTNNPSAGTNLLIAEVVGTTTNFYFRTGTNLYGTAEQVAGLTASSSRWDLAYLSAGTGAVFDASQASSSNRWDQFSASSNSYVATGSVPTFAGINMGGNINMNQYGLTNWFRPCASLSCSNDMPVTNTATEHLMYFTDVECTNGFLWSAATSNKITAQYAGTYVVFVSAIVDGSAANQFMDVWLKTNGVAVPRSDTRVGISGASLEMTLAVELLWKAAVNDYIEIPYAGDNVNLRVHATGPQASPTRPACPSVIMTIKPVSR